MGVPGDGLGEGELAALGDGDGDGAGEGAGEGAGLGEGLADLPFDAIPSFILRTFFVSCLLDFFLSLGVLLLNPSRLLCIANINMSDASNPAFLP